MRRSLFALACLALLSACGDSTQSLRELRLATLNTDPYQGALANSYRQLSEDTLAASDWNASEHFADKGLASAYGRDIEPDTLLQWPVDAEDEAQFTQARAQLMEAVAATKTTQPAQTATALVQFDRWLFLTSNGSDEAGIHAAHEAFAASLGALQQAQAPEAGTTVPTSEPQPLPEPLAAPAPAPEAAAPPEKPKLDITVLYFPFDSDSLGTSAKKVIGGLVEKIRTASAEARITINGHTDRAGSEPYNINLSERRAHYVQRALVKAGIPEKRTQAFGFGESDPAVATADDVREAKNRRVEIVVE
ncbi:MAG: OmpA family protein [Rickettsiales bacterium]